MKEKVTLIFKGEVYDYLTVQVLNNTTIQIKEIPFHLIGIRYNDIIEVEKVGQHYKYIKKIRITNCKRSRFLLNTKILQSEEFKEFLKHIEINGGDWELIMGGVFTVEIPKELKITPGIEIDKIYEKVEKNPKYKLEENFVESFLDIIEHRNEKKIEKYIQKFKDYYLIKLSGEIGIFHSIFNAISSLAELYGVGKIILDISELTDFSSSSNLGALAIMSRNLRNISGIPIPLRLIIQDNESLYNYFQQANLIDFFGVGRTVEDIIGK